MRALFLVMVVAFASGASADETKRSEDVARWLDHYGVAIGRYKRADFTYAQRKHGASCQARGTSMLTCQKKGSLSYDSASFGPEGRAHYFSLTLTTEESRKRCKQIAEHLKATYGTPSYAIEGGAVGFNLPKKRRHVEFGPTRGFAGCVLSIQAGVRSK